MQIADLVVTTAKLPNRVLPEMYMLSHHLPRLEKRSTKVLFDADPQRFEKMSVQLGSLLFDYSKNHLDELALSSLVRVAKDMNVESRRDEMFAGSRINQTENRAVLHTVLRQQSHEPLFFDGRDVTSAVRAVLKRMEAFANKVRTGEYSPSGKPIRYIVNIGIGGSDLGPRMVKAALAPYHDGPEIYYVSNVDGADIADTLKKLKPQNTLFVVASKTFTTQETMTNAATAFAWMEKEIGAKASDHFVALSTNLEQTTAFGIPKERTFGFWDWVGGRYSVWSAIGLSVMLAIGPDNFQSFLKGANQADTHFSQAKLSANIPVLMAVIGFWHRNVCSYGTHAILPYDNRLEYFSRWMQQLDMESNGKSVMMEGSRVDWPTSPVIFGEPGTNGQHAFYQMLHQGTDVIPCDFLVAAKGHEPKLDHQHQLLVANCLAQSQALMLGRTLEEADGNPHRVFTGNRPSNTFLYERLDPHTLGLLMALYEHKVFVQGILWGINSFDQWGVELGKELSTKIEPLVKSPEKSDAGDPSTSNLLNAFHSFRETKKPRSE